MSDLPRLISLATAVPPYRFAQTMTQDAARQVFAHRMRDFERLAPVYSNAGILTRYGCRPLEWYMTPRSWPEKNAAYLDAAVDLLEQVTCACLDRAALSAREIDAIVVVSSTGIATPSLDSRLIERMGMRPDTARLPIFGLGCGGGVLGLARAGMMARAMPGANVLLLVIELCTLAVQHDELTPTNIVATALFSDGAAAAIIRADTGDERSPALAGWGEHTWPGTRDVMGWRVEPDGFGVIFSQDIPNLVRRRMRPAADAMLARHDLTVGDLAGTVCHPGGVKVLAALEEALAPCREGFAEAWEVLRDYGNMSAATVMFVLERRMASGARGRHLMTALGPGFSAGFVLAEL
ncbi:MAG: type III polyketide synthase [Azospirillum sp.]|nr:type III polyketide synthase [Azospirillum sp.]